MKVLDVECLVASVGRILDRKEYVFLERIGCDRVLEARGDPERSNRPSNPRMHVD